MGGIKPWELIRIASFFVSDSEYLVTILGVNIVFNGLVTCVVVYSCLCFLFFLFLVNFNSCSVFNEWLYIVVCRCL